MQPFSFLPTGLSLTTGAVDESLHPLCRWYIYAIHGYFLEILFSATWAFLVGQDWQLAGVTSLWSLSIYGNCGLSLERIYLLLRDRCCLLTRCLLYTLCIYLWEFATGYVLRCFNACPWDYSKFRYNFMGLVTLDNGLFWFVSSLLLEKLLICNVLRLKLGAAWKPKHRPFPRFELKVD